MCEACEASDHENCTDWRPVPEGPVRRLLMAVFEGDNPQQCCCEGE